MLSGAEAISPDAEARDLDSTYEVVLAFRRVEELNVVRLTKWAVESRRLEHDPLVSLKRTEKRAIRPAHPRRALSPAEVRQLLNAAERRPLIELQTVRTGKHKGEMTAKVHDRVRAKALRIGRSRRLSYLLAVWAGLRRSEVQALEWRDINLDSQIPRITLRAETTKSKRGDSIVIHPELAAALKDARPSGAEPFCHVVKNVPGMKAVRADLRLAGVDPGSQKTGFVDFHALRKTLSTTMAAAGMSQRSRQAHMRHTDPRLTEGTYMDEKLLPVASELSQLPFFGQDGGESDTQLMHKTSGFSGQGGAKVGTSGHTGKQAVGLGEADFLASQVLKATRLGTNGQSPAPHGTGPSKQRVKGVEPSTFTLATGEVREPNSFADKELDIPPTGVDTKYAQNSRHSEVDPELQAIIDAWPTLQLNLRSAIVSILGIPISS